jgi:hypothetical protein
LPVELACGLVLSPDGGVNVERSSVFEKEAVAWTGATSTPSRMKVERIAEPRIRMAPLLRTLWPRRPHRVTAV